MDPVAQMLLISGMGITSIGLLVMNALMRQSKASVPNRTWIGMIQRDLFESIPPNDGTFAEGTLNGRNARVWLGDRSFSSHGPSGFRSTPVELRIQVDCLSSLDFTIYRMTNETIKFNHDEKYLPIEITRRDLIDIKQLGKPQLEQICELTESQRLRVFTSDPEAFKKWQMQGEAAGYLFNLLFLHAADRLCKVEAHLIYVVDEPNPTLLEVDSVKSMIQDMHGLSDDLESRTPNK